jgi:hypothetical protein
MFDTLEAPSEHRESPPPDLVPPEDLIGELAAVFSHLDRLGARAAHLLHQVNETEAYARDGYSSPTALLKHRMAMHPGEAQRLVQRSNGLAVSPFVAFAYARGALSGAQVDVLLYARCVAPNAFAEAEGDLVEMALDTPLVRDLRNRLDYWLDKLAADDLADDRALVRETRSLTLRRDGEMIRINGWVDVEAGERLRAILEPGPPAKEDTRSTPARRADRLMDILNGSSKRPNITVHVDSEKLLDRLPGLSETDDGTFLSADEIRRIACDACLTRVVFGPDGQPLDVGRTKRLVTPAMRIAVIARDRECVFPGCDITNRWCDVHHIIHWADDGMTRIENLVLLCRHHHMLVHEGGWTLTGNPGCLVFRRPDGTELGSARPGVGYRSPLYQIPEPTGRRIDMRSAIRQIKSIPYPRGPD